MNGYEGGAIDRPEEIALRLDALVRSFEAHPDERVRRDVTALLNLVDGLHRVGLTRMIEALREAGAAEAMLRALDEPSVQLLLEVYDLLPGDDPAPVEIVLDNIRPYLAQQGVQVSLLGAEGGVVRLRLDQSTPHDAASLDSLRNAIVSAVREQFPALLRVRFEGEADALPSNIIPLTLISTPPPRAEWQAAAALSDLPAGSLMPVTAGDDRLLLCNVSGAVFAVRDACPGSMLPLAPGRLEGAEVSCPWHGCRFDVRSGKRTAGVGAELDTFRVEVADGTIRLLAPAVHSRAAGR